MSDIERENLDACHTPHERKGEAMKQLEPYEQRMVDEYRELADRRQKLAAFLRAEAANNSDDSNVTTLEYCYMQGQLDAMDEYSTMLEQRMELHGIEYKESQ